jgi:hypothetical protein
MAEKRSLVFKAFIGGQYGPEYPLCIDHFQSMVIFKLIEIMRIFDLGI